MRSIVLICAAVAGLVAALATLHSSAAPVPTEPGMVPYTPTRIEWLAMELEASYREDIGSDNYSVHYLAKPPNTVLIFVRYTGKTSAAIVDRGIDTAKQLVKQDASSHGWSPWVKVEVNRKLVEK